VLRAAVVLLFASAALAYGPMTHISQTAAYLDLIDQYGAPGPRGDAALLTDPDNLAHFHLGATWPDIGRVLPEVPFEPHDIPFSLYVLDYATERVGDEPWAFAFAMGNMLHCLGDVSAQVFLTPYWSGKYGLAELDVVSGFFDDHPGGESELLIEVGLDLLYGDPGDVIDLATYFLASPDKIGNERFQRVLAYYLDRAAEYFGSAAVDPDRAEAAASRALASLADAAAALGESAGSPAVAYLAAAGPAIDRDELARLKGLPLLADPATWEEYFSLGFHKLGPWALRTVDAATWADWPTWSPRAMASGSLAGLARYNPAVYAEPPALVLFDFHWEDGSGRRLDAIDLAAPPAVVRAVAEVFSAVAASGTVTLRVRKDYPTDDYGADEVVAAATADYDIDPRDYGTTPRLVLTAEFDPSATIATAAAYYPELVAGGDVGGKAFLSGDWWFYEQSDGINVFKPSYAALYAGPTDFPATLPVLREDFPQGTGTIAGRVFDRLTGKGIRDATVEVDGADPVTTNGNGFYVVDGFAAGTVDVSAEADGYDAATPVNVEVMAATKVYAPDLILTPRVTARDAGRYTADGRRLTVWWDGPAGPDAVYQVAVGTTPGATDVRDWTDVGQVLGAVVDFMADPLTDGETYYLAARLLLPDGPGDADATDGITVDASPPDRPVVSAPRSAHRDETVAISWDADDPHTGIANCEACLGRSAGACDLLAAHGVGVDGEDFDLAAIDPPPGTMYIQVRCANPAGLWSEWGSATMRVADEKDDERSGCGG
jgi:hypothetical protein